MKQWDVFISHATEDKETIVEPLAELLRIAGIKVWVDKDQIKLGDSLRAKIDEGLAMSRFGVVVLSPAFLAKHWTTQELNGLSAREEKGRKVILPVWHGLEKAVLIEHSPMLADRRAARTKDGLPAVAHEILGAVLAPDSASPSATVPSVARRLANLVDANAEPEKIFAFLQINPWIAMRFSTRTPLPYLVPLKPEHGAPGFLAWTGHRSHGGTTAVVVGPVDGPLFDATGQAVSKLKACFNCVELVRDQIATGTIFSADGEQLPAPLDARIMAGRRNNLTGPDLRGIELQKANGLVIRTYELAMDLAGTVDQ